MKKLYTILFIMLIPSFLISQTVVDTTHVFGIWTQAASPYLITNDIELASDDTLVIEPGVQVIFEDYYLFQVLGQFSAIGNEVDSIYFTVDDTSGYSTNNHNGWAGMELRTFLGDIDMSYCVVEYSKHWGGIYFDGDVSSFSHCSVRYNNTGIVIANGLDMDYVKIYSNRYDGISNGSWILTTLTDFEIYNNGGRGIKYASNSKLNADRGIIKNNKGGGILVGYESQPTLDSIIIESNGDINVQGGGIMAGGTCFLTNLTIKNNTALDGGIKSSIPGFEDLYLSNSIIKNNEAMNIGGGICQVLGGTYFSNIQIFNNVANNGGGMSIGSHDNYNPYNSSGLTIENNHAYGNGGGIYYVQYNGNYVNITGTITNNTADLNGGGIYLQNCNGLDIEANIANNSAGQNGGGIYSLSTKSTAISNSKITSNSATDGGGLYFKNGGLHTMNHVEISNNLASGSGGAMFIDAVTQNMNMNNITNVFNSAELSGGGIHINSSTSAIIQLLNSVFWNNSPDQITDPNEKLMVTYSDMEGGHPGMGNMDANPLFVDTLNASYHLSWLNFPIGDSTKSPCIGTGSNSADIGAYPFEWEYYEQFIPVIDSIIDVPDDQGKQVMIHWTGCVLDSANGSIDKYTFWRKQEGTKESWAYMGFTNAQNLEEYTFVAPTLLDSNAMGVPYFTFLVRATETDSTKYYNSYPATAYSIDNMAPNPPQGLMGLLDIDTLLLYWNISIEEDFDHFAVYKSEDSHNFPDTAYLILTDTNYMDMILEHDTLYFCLSAFDLNGNESLRSDTIEVVMKRIILDLKVFLEGPFVLGEMTPFLNTNGYLPFDQPYDSLPWNYMGSETVDSIPSPLVIDWVLVDLLMPIEGAFNQSFERFSRKIAFILTDGTIKGLDGISNLGFTTDTIPPFYVQIHHRNHVSVISAIPLTQSDGLYAYDFTTDAEKALGSIYNQKQIGAGIWGLLAADGNANNQIDNNDKNEVWWTQKELPGYNGGDFNMNGQVGEDDRQVTWLENVGKGISFKVYPYYVFTCGDTLIDARDDNKYTTTWIGEQCWMAENLNYGTMIDQGADQSDNDTVEKYCMDNLKSNCSIYGANYQWSEIMNYTSAEGSQGICPDGWHIPTDSEWCVLENFVDADTVDCNGTGYRGIDGGGHLKQTGTSLWMSPNIGATNSSGLSAKPGGYYNYFLGQIDGVGLYGQFFTSTTTAPDNPWTRGLQYDLSTIRRKSQSGEFGQNLRCIKD
jgi:uncharacterized protein (TIGR02145 family)